MMASWQGGKPSERMRLAPDQRLATRAASAWHAALCPFFHAAFWQAPRAKLGTIAAGTHLHLQQRLVCFCTCGGMHAACSQCMEMKLINAT